MEPADLGELEYCAISLAHRLCCYCDYVATLAAIMLNCAVQHLEDFSLGVS